MLFLSICYVPGAVLGAGTCRHNLKVVRTPDPKGAGEGEGFEPAQLLGEPSVAAQEPDQIS